MLFKLYCKHSAVLWVLRQNTVLAGSCVNITHEQEIVE